MPKYLVSFDVTYVHDATTEVEASSLEEAEEWVTLRYAEIPTDVLLESAIGEVHVELLKESAGVLDAKPLVRESADASLTMWAVLVTDGTVLAYPPEIYATQERAEDESWRWAWQLSSGNIAAIYSPFRGRLEAGCCEIRVVTVAVPEDAGDLWIGIYWTRDGYPEPEGAAFTGREAAIAWVRDDVEASVVRDVTITDWYVVGSFFTGKEEATAVASRAKVIR